MLLELEKTCELDDRCKYMIPKKSSIDNQADYICPYPTEDPATQYITWIVYTPDYTSYSSQDSEYQRDDYEPFFGHKIQNPYNQTRSKERMPRGEGVIERMGYERSDARNYFLRIQSPCIDTEIHYCIYDKG